MDVVATLVDARPVYLAADVNEEPVRVVIDVSGRLDEHFAAGVKGGNAIIVAWNAI